jgi:hypothetical protein
MGIQFVERHFASVEELQGGVRALRAGEVDAYLEVADPMVNNQSQLIIDTTRTKKVTDHVQFPKSSRHVSQLFRKRPQDVRQAIQRREGG